MAGEMPSYREVGTGFPVICLHASAGGPGQWRPLMARLAGRYRVLAPARIGYGGNPPWVGDRSARLADEVAALAPLLDAIGPSCALVGHSAGGSVALKAALTHPDLVRALVIYEPALFAPLVRHRPDDPATAEIVAFGAATSRAVLAGDLDSAAGPGPLGRIAADLRERVRSLELEAVQPRDLQPDGDGGRHRCRSARRRGE